MEGPATTTLPVGQEADRRDRFHHLLLAEWTKLRSVPRWMLALAAAVGLTVLVAMLSAAGSTSSEVPIDGGAAPPDPDGTGQGGAAQHDHDIVDELHFVHQPLAGDGTIAARVVTQKASQEWAKAGIMLKERAERGAPYAALMVTPDHGVRLQSDFTEDVAGSDGTTPRWLKLTRSGDAVTGYESGDGATWDEVGTVQLDGLPRTVEVGMFVTSPNEVVVERQAGSEDIREEPTVGQATFDNVSVTGPGAKAPSGAAWSDYDASMLAGLGGSTEAGGVFTLEGSGDVGKRDDLFGQDLVQDILMSVIVGLIAIVALGVLFATSEHKRGMIRTTLAASPRRGRVLAAKAVAIGGVTFVAGLVASLVSFAVAEPVHHADGLRPDGFPETPLTDPTVLRAIVGTAALIAVVAVLSLGVGVMLRRSAGAITVVVLLLLLPPVIGPGLPLAAEQWLTRLTPSAGFAVQQTMERYDTAIAPMAGFGVLCAYAAAALGGAFWLLQRRDA